MLISLAYRLTRRILGAVATLARRDVSSATELLVLRHENTVLRRRAKKVCHRPEDRLWFAVLSGLIPRRRWAEVFPVTPGTAPAWHRRLMEREYTSTASRPGRKPTCVPVRTLVIRMATENPMWGHRRVQGELARLGHKVSASTVWGILHDAGIDPAPRRRGPTWRQFQPAQAHGILAVDFVHVDTILLKCVYALILGERHLRLVLQEFLAHYNAVRPHRSLGQLRPRQAETAPPPPISLADYRLRRKPILGGLTSEYHAAA